MEIDKTKLNEKSNEIGNSKKECFSNYETSSYCLDLSDMRDENYEFWDFLKQTVEIKRKLNEKLEKSPAQMKGFLDFIEPSTKTQQAPNRKLPFESKEFEAMRSPSDSEFYDARSYSTSSVFDCNIHKQDDNNEKFGELSKSKEVEASESNDGFWDFLKCGSPMRKNASESDLCEINSTHTPSDFNCDSNKQGVARQLSNEHKESASNEVFWDFLKISSPAGENSIDSEDDFWDFLKSNTLTAEFRDVLNSITGSRTTTPVTNFNSTFVSNDESPFGADLSSCVQPGKSHSTPFHAGINNAIRNVAAKTVSQTLHDLTINKLDQNNRVENSVRSDNTIRNFGTQQNSLKKLWDWKRASTEYSEMALLTDDISVEKVGSTSTILTNKDEYDSKEYTRGVIFENKHPKQTADLPCQISSVFTIQSNNGTKESDKIIPPTKPLKSSNKTDTIIENNETHVTAQANNEMSFYNGNSETNSSIKVFKNTPLYPQFEGATNEISKNYTDNRNMDGIGYSDTIIKNNLNDTTSVEYQKHERNNKRPLVQSPIGCSSFNICDDFQSTCVLPIANLNSENISNEISKKQKPQSEEKILENARENVFKNATNANFVNLTQLKSVTTNFEAKNSNSSAPVYFILPSSSETLQNPNYSHYFLIVNNPPDSQQSISQNKSQLPLIKSFFPSTIASVISTNVPQTVYGIKKDCGFQIPFENSNSKLTSVEIPCNRLIKEKVVESEISKVADDIKYQVDFKPNYTLSVPNPINTSISHVIGNLKTVPCSVKPIGNEIGFQPLTKIDRNSAKINSFPKTSILGEEHGGSLPNVSDVTQPVEIRKINSSLKTNPLKNITPIKNISLGKDKNAIQQISVPLKIENILKDKSLIRLEGNSKSSSYDTILNPSPIISFPRNKICVLPKATQTIQVLTTVPTKEKDLELRSLSRNTNAIELQNKNPSNDNKNLNQLTYTVNSNFSVMQNQNDPSCSFNIRVPVANNVHQNMNNSVKDKQKESINGKQDLVSREGNSSLSNQYIQVKLAPSQNNSLATLQELFPPPISMVPVNVMPHTRNLGQSNVSKVLVVRETLDDQSLINQKVQFNPVATRYKANSRRLKMKKCGRKTVRELLAERRLINEGVKKKPLKEVRILKRILKLPVETVAPDNLQDVTKTLPILSNKDVNFETVSSSKRPNILVLPSGSKFMKKNIIKNDVTKNLVRMRQLDFEEPSASIMGEAYDEHSYEVPISFKNNKRDFRPRHYDISELQIGSFKVEDDCEYSYGRFRSKFKVIFSKRQFLYDFPVSRCNRMNLKSSEIWEKRARIVVCFKSVISTDLRDRIIQVTVSSAPNIYLGRLQVRAGIISNTTVYDTPIEDDSPWCDDIKNTFIHKVILRKRQANKLRALLCQFDKKFVTLSSINAPENGAPHSNDMLMFEEEMSSASLKKNLAKSKNSRIRRLPQWDSPEDERQKSSSEDVLPNQMCSCRISCRSIRCSCVKAAKSCKNSSVCLCINCDNPLNILESLGMNIDFSLSDSCLFQNIYPLPKLRDFLQREIKLTCCNTFARVQDCIPGTVLCPNVDCNVQLEFSWCRGIVCYPERNPRNHCSFCGQCCFSNKRHCLTCNRCYVVSPKLPYCPTCREIAPVCSMKEFESQIPRNFPAIASYENQKASNKATSKPEIIILDSFSISKSNFSMKEENVVEPEKEITPVEHIHDIITVESPVYEENLSDCLKNN